MSLPPTYSNNKTVRSAAAPRCTSCCSEVGGHGSAANKSFFQTPYALLKFSKWKEKLKWMYALAVKLPLTFFCHHTDPMCVSACAAWSIYSPVSLSVQGPRPSQSTLSGGAVSQLSRRREGGKKNSIHFILERHIFFNHSLAVCACEMASYIRVEMWATGSWHHVPQLSAQRFSCPHWYDV